MARKTKVVTWYALLCVACPESHRLTSHADAADRDARMRHHRITHPTHQPLDFDYAGYGGEAFAANDALTKLVKALMDTEQLNIREDT